MLGKILGKGQPARNFMGHNKIIMSIKHKGSLETRREIDNKDNVYLKDEFKYWFSGFTDSVGCFTASTIKNAKYNSTQVTVRFILSQKD